ncbi:hypothetical protein TIFTF001_003367 [Ficus carica]|uniref:Uncharacterized protein n=1 Tax=Ficus carica TaxID=3494 RepID=A0AA87ZS82_FICCA|nr:hypothetical protein TIFTF001_003367 [Ficus carica]
MKDLQFPRKRKVKHQLVEGGLHCDGDPAWQPLHGGDLVTTTPEQGRSHHYNPFPRISGHGYRLSAIGYRLSLHCGRRLSLWREN